MKRLQQIQKLPRNYPFLTRHSAASFLTYTTYDFSSAAFVRYLTVSHGLGYAPLHDMWVAKKLSVTGNARLDYSPTIEPIYYAPVELYDTSVSWSTLESYICYTDKYNVTIKICHLVASSGTYHVYFHVKLYADDFEIKDITI